MKNINKKLVLSLVLVVGVLLGSLIFYTKAPESKTIEDITVFTDTLVLENQGEIDIYAVDNGKWIVISLDDLRYVVKKKRKTIISDLESLFERFEVPERVSVKPTFK